jgi:hypothetical protein
VLRQWRQLQQRDVFLGEIRERLLQAQDHMKEQHDKHRRNVEFAVGDWVLLRLHHRAAAGITERTCAKLAPKFYRLFQVLERVGSLAYRLQLPPKARIHDVFHVVFLKKFEGVPPAAVPHLPPINHNCTLAVPSRVKRARPTGTSWELLVFWEGHDAADASCVDVQDFEDRYPDFKLEDELFSQAGGSVMDSMFGRQFRRRPKQDQAPGS